MNILRKKRYDVMKEMIEDIPFLLESLRGYDDATLLMSVALFKTDVDLFRFLLSFDQDLNIVNEDGLNIVRYIVIGDVNVVVEKLDVLTTKTTNILFKSLINRLDKYGQSPLHRAAELNNHKTIIYLIENEANLNIRDNKHRLPEEHEDCNEETKLIFQRYRK